MVFDQFLEYMRLGGSIMWIILALSILAAAIVIERIIFFAASSTDLKSLDNALAGISEVSDGERGDSCFTTPVKGSTQRLFSAARECWSSGDEKLSLRLEGEVRGELYKWERNLSLLEIITRVAPLLGLLGTVVAMVEMFGSMDTGGAIDARAVTGGIWKALLTTVAGLSVAIPTLVAHGFLSNAVSREEETLEQGVNLIMSRWLDFSRFSQTLKEKTFNDTRP